MASTPFLFLLRPLLFSAALFSLQLQPLSASSQSDQLLLHLTHSLTYFNSPNATIHHLLKTSSIRSAARHRRHQRRQEVSLPLSAGSDYTLSLSLSVGPPDSSTTVQLYMDTGSDLVWFPCSTFECILCEGKETPSASPSPPPPLTPTSLPPTSAPSQAAPLMPSRPPPRAPPTPAPASTTPTGTAASSPASAAAPFPSGPSASQISPSPAPTPRLPSPSASLASAAPVPSHSPSSSPSSPPSSPPASPTASSSPFS